ncbi:50S ribosomal protein L13 [Geobacter sp. AOG2]|nr:50S ribosomal protein L13 [Geobacter sp. AOG2]GFE59930.1 50S ribosomal protein L13 [Geobacter sp. AOG2]
MVCLRQIVQYVRKLMKTEVAKAENVKRDWYLVDAQDAVLGRLATQIANVLRGKNKAIFTPSVDTGDFVIVVNAEKIALTGRKLDDKMYYHHTGFPGGLKEITAGKLLEKKPEDLIRKAVKGMLPKNKLARHMLKKLKVYAGASHPHDAQQPKNLAF